MMILECTDRPSLLTVTFKVGFPIVLMWISRERIMGVISYAYWWN